MDKQTISIVVRAVEVKGRVRVLEPDSGLYVCCPVDWRDSMIPDTPYRIDAHLRADSLCWVASRFLSAPERPSV